MLRVHIHIDGVIDSDDKWLSNEAEKNPERSIP